MALEHVAGLDHVVVLVRDLGAAAETWRGLGFTVAPRGIHSAYKGTGNHTIMLGQDYVELLGILVETPPNISDRAALGEHGEGLDRAALRTTDAGAGLAALAARGLSGTGPSSFSRPVSLPDGTVTEAAFRTFEWPPDAAPAGLRLFACEHLTPDAVWVPELTRHPNGATGILRLEILSDDPEEDAGELADLTNATAESCPDGAWRVGSGPGRADFVVLDPSLLAARHPGVSVVECRASGAAALVLAVDDLATTASRLPAAIPTGPGRLALPPQAANGVLLAFEQR